MPKRLAALTACAVFAAVAAQAPAAGNEQALRKLEEKIQAGFDDVPLATAIEFLKVRTDLKIDVNWRLLGKIKVAKTTPVIFELSKQSVRTILNVLCTVTGGDKMTWTLEEGAVKISTSASLRHWRTNRTFSVRPAAEANTLTVNDMSQRLAVLIRATEASSLRQQGAKVTVGATLEGHRRVDRLVEMCIKGPAAGSQSEIGRARVRLAVKNLPEVSFVDTPLKLVVTFIQNMTGQGVVVDWPAIKTVGLTPKTTVNISMKNVSALKVIDTIVAQLSERGKKVETTVIADANVLVITTPPVIPQHVYSVAFELLPRSRKDNTPASITMTKTLADRIKEMMGAQYWRGDDKVLLPVGKARLICINTEREIKTVSNMIDALWGQKPR